MIAVCLWDHMSGEVPRASVEAPWAPASLVPGSNPTQTSGGGGGAMIAEVAC